MREHYLRKMLSLSERFCKHSVCYIFLRMTTSRDYCPVDDTAPAGVEPVCVCVCVGGGGGEGVGCHH